MIHSADEVILQLVSVPETCEDGFRQLVGKYQHRLYQVVRRQLPTHEDADDVLQNTFLKVFKNLQSFEKRSELFTWMYRIASNEVKNHHKRNSRMKIVELGNELTGSPEHDFRPDHLQEELETIVSGLPERQQMVFRMRYYDELSYSQMADILQLTEGALKASFHHAVKKIETELKANQIV